ncbi:Dolichyl N-acetyl-alpha-D-glucosaminyl phosphate 3-beta-D-2,3-diacetamido-2,3-dideoxy-beta-D-glucuronosyltransferase [uncultured archaeon]|nr:Dolichyl N-acetyl-alpha-D-glucosaminyl phosphate 3-beta-D-2,3-diacetamido-2,3-dideoxy-beta-D-glucuronosyltransferase [uncultured archaeon]
MKDATVIIPTRNEEKNMNECLAAYSNQDYNKKKFGILVIDDCSTDRTADVVKKYAKKDAGFIEYIKTPSRLGRVKSLNLGIAKCDTPVFIEMNADCIPEKNWFRVLMNGFSDKKIAVVKTTSLGEGASSAYRTDVVKKLGMFDERYNEMGSGFRMDTDLMFSILDAGYEIKRISGTGYEHKHPAPATFKGKIKYAISRVKVHRFDPLLYKNHPQRTKEMLDIRWGFLRNPALDFKTATGLWRGTGSLELSSPQGIKIIENKTPLHGLVIVILGISYVFAVKLARLYGSIKFGKLLV